MPTTDIESPEYAQQWHQWVQTQPWFQAAIQQLRTNPEAFYAQLDAQYGDQPHAPSSIGDRRNEGVDPANIASQNVPAKNLRNFNSFIVQESGKAGMRAPRDYSLDAQGTMTHNDFLTRNPWFMYVMLAAGVGAGTIASLAGPAAAASIAGTSGAPGTVAAAGGGTAATGGGAAAGGTAAATTMLEDGTLVYTATGAPVAAGSVGGAATTGTLAGAGATSSSFLSKLRGAGDIASDISPILGSAAQGSNSGTGSGNGSNSQAMANAIFRLNAPRTRLNAAGQASVMRNAQPVHAVWGGPGSGLRGETVHYENALGPQYLDGDARRVADNELSNLMHDSLVAGKDQELPDPNQSTGSKILGGAALATSLLGAFKNRNRSTV